MTRALTTLLILASCTSDPGVKAYVWHDQDTDKAWIEAWGLDGSRWCVSSADMNLECDWLDAHGGHLP